MNKIITLLLLVLTFSISAQNQLAKEVLDKLSSTTESYENMSIDFEFIFENKSQEIRETQNGKIILENDNFKLELDNQIIFNDGETQWIYNSDINELQIIEHDSEDEMMNPDKLFKIYEKDYKYTYIGAESKNGERLHVIDLFPEESNSFMKITLYINVIKNQLEKLILFDKNGGTYSYIINTFKSNSLTEPLDFNIDQYSDIEIIDLR